MLLYRMIVAVICLIFLALETQSQIPSYNCLRVCAPDMIAIDGNLNEPCWAQADSIRLVDVVTGANDPQPTSVRVLWDSVNLYIGFMASDDLIGATLTRHDTTLYQQDVVEMFIDPDRNGTDYYELEWNCRNASFDAYVTYSGGSAHPDLSWDAVDMKSAVSVKGTVNNNADKDTSWCAEIALPWKNLTEETKPAVPVAGGSMKIGFFRIELRTSSTIYTSWVPTGAIQFHRPDKFGTLRFGPCAGTDVKKKSQINGNSACLQENTACLLPLKKCSFLNGSRSLDLSGRVLLPGN